MDASSFLLKLEVYGYMTKYKKRLDRYIGNDDADNLIIIDVSNYAQLLQDIRNVLFILNRY